MAKAKIGLVTKGFAKASVKIETVTKKLLDPTPGLYDVMRLFEIMEAERFTQGGLSTFGTDAWEPAGSKWLNEKTGKGADHPLVNFGYLETAATLPQILPIGKQAMIAAINPTHTGAPGEYGGSKKNYGYFHQTGDTSDGVKRQFITVTPLFMLEARVIMWTYFALGSRKLNQQAEAKGKSVEGMRRSRNLKRRDWHNGSSSAVKSEDRAFADHMHMRNPSRSPYDYHGDLLAARRADTALKEAAAKAKNGLTSADTNRIVKASSNGTMDAAGLESVKHSWSSFKSTYGQKVKDGMHTE